MSQTAIDIAWSRPTVAQIQATGATGVLRYLSTDPTKNLTASETSAYHAAGLGTAVVWETTTSRSTQGFQAGVDDATVAEGQRKADGLPADCTIYLATDSDQPWAAVADYYRGAHSVLGTNAAGLRRAGVYGGFAVIEGAAADGYHYLWQTIAWSGGRRSAHAVLYQNGATVLGGNADVNDILAPDWGQYPSPGGDIVLDAATAAQIKALVVDATWNHTEINATDGKTPVRMGAVMAWMDRVHAGQVSSLTAQIGALTAVVSALAKQGGLTAEQATAAAKAGADAALAEAEAAAKRVVDALQPPAAPAKP